MMNDFDLDIVAISSRNNTDTAITSKFCVLRVAILAS